MNGSCPNCHATLPAADCPVCTELSHIDYLLREAARWREKRLITDAQFGSLSRGYAGRRSDLLDGGAPRPDAPVAFPEPPTRPAPPPAPPPEPDEPTEWERFREATNVSWMYGVGVLFVTAALFWLVAASSGTILGRWVLFAVVAGLGAASWMSGRWLLSGLELRTGGQALLAVGALLGPAAMWALAAALGLPAGLIDGWFIGVWAASAALAAWAAWRWELPSQLVLANLFATAAAIHGVRLLHGGWPPDTGWYGLLLSPLAALNVALAHALGGPGRDEAPGRPLVATARSCAGVLMAAAALALLAASARVVEPGLDPVMLLGPLLLAGALALAAHEANQPALIGLAAACAYLAGVLLDDAGQASLVGEALVVAALLAGAGGVRERRADFGRWYLAAAAVLTLALVVSGVVDVQSARIGLPAALSGWAVAGVYLYVALTWREAALYLVAVALATLAVVLNGAAAGLSAAWWAAGEAVLAAAVLMVGPALQAREWRDTIDRPQGPDAPDARRPGVGEALPLAALVPLAAGASMAWWAVVAETSVLLAAAAAVVLTALCVALSYQARRRGVLYLAVATAGAAGAALGMWAPLGLGPLLGVALGAVALQALAMAGDEHLQPLEVSAFALACLAALGVLWVWSGDGPSLRLALALLLCAGVFAVPALPRCVGRAHAPGLSTCGARPWLATASVALAAAMVTQRLRLGADLGFALVGLAGVLLSNRVGRESLWRGPLCNAGLTAALLAAFWSAEFEQPLWTRVALLASQGAVLLGAGDRGGVYALGGLHWLIVSLVLLFESVDPSGSLARPVMLAQAAVHLAIAAGYLSRTWRSQTATLVGLVGGTYALGSLAEELLRPPYDNLALGAAVVAVAAYGLVLARRELRLAATGAAALAALVGLMTIGVAIEDGPVWAALMLLGGYTAAATAGSLRGGLSPLLPVALGNLTVAYALWQVYEPPTGWTPPTFGLPLTLVALADVALAAGAKRWERWRDAALVAAAAVGGFALVMLLAPPERATVFGLVVLSAAAMTAAWVRGEAWLVDVGAALAWLAGAIVLIDASRHGRGELAPYRSLDVYAVPLAVYLLAMGERRAANPAAVRLTAMAMLLGSLLISAFAADSPLHDAALFIAVMGAVVYGVRRGDTAVRWAGVAAFAGYVLVFAWQYKYASRWLLIPLLLLLGVGAIAFALAQERKEKA